MNNLEWLTMNLVRHDYILSRYIESEFVLQYHIHSYDKRIDLLDQMKLMTTSGMTQSQIKETIIANVTDIIDNFEPEKESKSL